MAALDSAERVRPSGDVTLGRISGSVRPDLERLAVERPDLLERLAALADTRVRLRAVIDPSGELRRVTCDQGVDPEVDALFEAALRSGSFEGSVHHTRGPVPVELVVDYFINPRPHKSSLYERGQRLAGDEVAEIVRVLGPGAAIGRMPDSPRVGFYARLVGSGDPPPLRFVEEAIYTFVLGIDEQGSVNEVQEAPSPANSRGHG